MVATGAYLRAYRKHNGLTQGDIAEALRLSGARVVTDWEKGKRKPLAHLFALWVEMVGADPATAQRLILADVDAAQGAARANAEFQAAAAAASPRTRQQVIAEIQARLDRLTAEGGAAPTGGRSRSP